MSHERNDSSVVQLTKWFLFICHFRIVVILTAIGADITMADEAAVHRKKFIESINKYYEYLVFNQYPTQVEDAAEMLEDHGLERIIEATREPTLEAEPEQG